MKHTRPKSGRSAPPGQRQLRVGERIRHILADILQRGSFHDPDLLKASRITVTSVHIGPDLQHATAYIMPLGGEEVEKTLAALNRAAGFFRAELGRELDLRYTPKIFFRADDTFDKADEIERLLRQEKVRRDVEKEVETE
jgi:ribosome-binding factor A